LDLYNRNKRLKKSIFFEEFRRFSFFKNRVFFGSLDRPPAVVLTNIFNELNHNNFLNLEELNSTLQTKIKILY